MRNPDVSGLLLESQGHNLAWTVSYVPCSLEQKLEEDPHVRVIRQILISFEKRIKAKPTGNKDDYTACS